MRRAADQAEMAIGGRKPVHHALRVQPALPFRLENVAGGRLALGLMEELQGLLKLAVHRNCSPSAAFRDALGKQDLVADGGVTAKNHFPPQPGYFTSAQARLEAEQDNHPVPLSVTTSLRVLQ
jgi:hypothetical protein